MSIGDYRYQDGYIQPIADAFTAGGEPTREAMAYLLWALMMREKQIDYLNEEINAARRAVSGNHAEAEALITLHARAAPLRDQEALAKEWGSLNRAKRAFSRRRKKTQERLISRQVSLDLWLKVTRGEASVASLAVLHGVGEPAIRRQVARGRAAFRAGLEYEVPEDEEDV